MSLAQYNCFETYENFILADELTQAHLFVAEKENKIVLTALVLPHHITTTEQAHDFTQHYFTKHNITPSNRLLVFYTFTSTTNLKAFLRETAIKFHTKHKQHTEINLTTEQHKALVKNINALKSKLRGGSNGTDKL